MIELDSEEYPNNSNIHSSNNQIINDNNLPSNSRKRFLRDPMENENIPKKINPSTSSSASASSAVASQIVDDKSRIPRFHDVNNATSSSSSYLSPINGGDGELFTEYIETDETLTPEDIGKRILKSDKDNPNIQYANREICRNKALNLNSDGKRLPCTCMECFPNLSSRIFSHIHRVSEHRQNLLPKDLTTESIQPNMKQEEPVAGPSGLNKKSESASLGRAKMFAKMYADSSDSEDEERIMNRYYVDMQNVTSAERVKRLVYIFSVIIFDI